MNRQPFRKSELFKSADTVNCAICLNIRYWAPEINYTYGWIILQIARVIYY